MSYKSEQSGDYLSVASPSQLFNLSAFTISFWVYQDSTLDQDGYLFDLASNKTIHVDASGRLKAKVSCFTVDSSVTTSSSFFPKNEWQHISLTYDSAVNEIHLYVTDNNNWREVGTTINGSAVLKADDGDLRLLERNDAPSRWFPGRIAEMGIWNRVLSTTELQNLGIHRWTPSLITSGILGAWRLIDDTVDSVSGNNAVENGNIASSTHVPLILTTISSQISDTTVYAPNLTSPMGGEIFNQGTVSITWNIKDPPTSQSDLTLSNVTYELSYTENYIDEGTTDWHTIRKRITGSDTSYSWRVGRMIKSDQVRLRIRAFCESINRFSEYSSSPDDFSINVFKLTPPAILSPIASRTYTDYVTIILDEEQVVNTYNQKVRYTFEYSSEKADVDWTSVFQSLPVGSSPLRWNVDDLATADDYQLRLTVSDPDGDQFTRVYVRDLNIIHPGLFYIDTKPPTGVIEIENYDQVTNVLEHVVNLYADDEITETKSVALKETNAGDILTLGKIDANAAVFDPLQIDACAGFQDIANKGYVPKINWKFADSSGMKLLKARLTDYGENNSCQEKDHLFMRLWNVTEDLTDLLITTEQQEYYSINPANGNVTTTTAFEEMAYISTELGKLYKMNPYPNLIYDLGFRIHRIAKYVNVIYLFVYRSTNDNGYVYRDDKVTEPTLLTTFTNPLSIVNDAYQYGNYLYMGMQNGELWRFDGTAFTLLTTFGNPINRLSADSKYLYIGFFSGTEMSLYNGTTFTSLDIEI